MSRIQSSGLTEGASLRGALWAIGCARASPKLWAKRGIRVAGSSLAQRLRLAPMGTWAPTPTVLAPLGEDIRGGAQSRRRRFSSLMGPRGRTSSSGNPRCRMDRPVSSEPLALKRCPGAERCWPPGPAPPATGERWSRLLLWRLGHAWTRSAASPRARTVPRRWLVGHPRAGECFRHSWPHTITGGRGSLRKPRLRCPFATAHLLFQCRAPGGEFRSSLS